MPTKRNRAGQQQNYVPQGNGDASGEYADEATGSNKHFANFKKPDEAKPEEKVNSQLTNENVKSDLTKSVEQPKEDTSKYLGGSKVKSEFSATVFSKGMSKYGEDFKKDFKEIIAKADERCISLINYSIMNHNISFIKDGNKSSYFNETTKEINIKPEELIRGFDEDGETVFHELGHYINEVNKTREDEKWYRTDNKMTDTHKYFDDGKSVTETLQEELKEFAAAKYAPKIRADQRKYLNQKLKPYGFTAQEFERLSDQANNIIKTSEEWAYIKESIRNDWNNGRIPTMEEANLKVKEEFDKWKKTGSYKEIFVKLDEQRPLYRKHRDDWAKANGIKALSDAWSSKSDFGFGYGHSRGYYKKSWMNPEPHKLVADEMFANFFAALTTHNQQVLDTTKKYLPRTYEKMVKLVDVLEQSKKIHDEMKEKIEQFQRGEQI